MDNYSVSFLKWIIFTTLLPYLEQIPGMPFIVFGFSLRGWAWIIMLMVSVITLLRGNQVTMPVWIWLPFLIYIFGYNLFDFSFVGVQLSLQYSVSLFVGFAASSIYYSEQAIERIYRIFRSFMWLFILLCATTYALYSTTPYSAATVMTLTVFAAVFLYSFYAEHRWMGLAGYLCCLIFPFLMVTRMGIAAMFTVGLAHLANRSFIRKGLIGGGLILIASMAFHSERFQSKSFGKKGGEYSDISIENKDFNTSGRKAIYDVLKPGLTQHPVWGNGPRADLRLLEKKGFLVKEVHNDYLAVRYNYGYAGLAFLLFGFVMQAWFIFRKRHFLTDEPSYRLYAIVLTLFIPFLLLMYSDNVLKYSIFFGNYHFAMIGMLYRLQHDT